MRDGNDIITSLKLYIIAAGLSGAAGCMRTIDFCRINESSAAREKKPLQWKWSSDFVAAAGVVTENSSLRLLITLLIIICLCVCV